MFCLQEAASERDKLAKQVPELQQQLETELLARTDLENRNMTLKEELAFKQQVSDETSCGCLCGDLTYVLLQMYEREMTEVRTSKQVEISEIDGRLQEDYQARLQSALQDLRDHYESQMHQNREEISNLYQNKVIWPSVSLVVNDGQTNLLCYLDSKLGGPGRCTTQHH